MPEFPVPLLPWSLEGTLPLPPGFMGKVSEADAAMQRIKEQQMAKQLAASGAFGEAQTAAQTPAPAAQPMDALPQFFGDLASIISRRPEFQRRRQEEAQQERQEMIAKRSENLTLLRDRYQQLALDASKIDPVAHLEYLEKTEKVNKQLEQMSKLQEQGFQREQLQTRLASEEKQAGIRAANSAAGSADIDPEAIFQEIVKGNLPPIGTNLGRSGTWAKIVSKFGPYNAAQRAAGKPEISLAKMQTDWQAIQRFYTQINGRQQIQIRQSAITIIEGLNKLRELNAEFGRIAPRFAATPLNKLINTAVRDLGAGGPEAQQIAIQMRSLVADLIPEFANVYQAGGVPTDRAMITAEKALNADNNAVNLEKQIALAESQLEWRLGAVQNAPALTTGPSLGVPSTVLAGTKLRALTAARSGDLVKVRQMLTENPELETDSALMEAVRRARAQSR